MRKETVETKTFMRTSPSFDYMADAKWWIIDAKDKPIGRLATTIATILRGKHDPQYTPHLLSKDKIVVINVEQALFTGKKKEQKIYYRHTGYFGGLKEYGFDRFTEKDPTAALHKAVERMLHSRTPLGKRALRNLYLHVGAEHSHTHFLNEVTFEDTRNTIFKKGDK